MNCANHVYYFVHNYYTSSLPIVVIDFVRFWCIDVPSMVAISLTGLFSAHNMDTKLYNDVKYCDHVEAN